MWLFVSPRSIVCMHDMLPELCNKYDDDRTYDCINSTWWLKKGSFATSFGVSFFIDGKWYGHLNNNTTYQQKRKPYAFPSISPHLPTIIIPPALHHDPRLYPPTKASIPIGLQTPLYIGNASTRKFQADVRASEFQRPSSRRFRGREAMQLADYTRIIGHTAAAEVGCVDGLGVLGQGYGAHLALQLLARPGSIRCAVALEPVVPWQLYVYPFTMQVDTCSFSCVRTVAFFLGNESEIPLWQFVENRKTFNTNVRS